MLRFSIREMMLVMLCVACFAGWGKEFANAAAARARHRKELQQHQELLASREKRIYSLERLTMMSEQLSSLTTKLKLLAGDEKPDLLSENVRLEAENARLQRRLLDHDTQLEILLERFHRSNSGR
jgi:hypothetical protein